MVLQVFGWFGHGMVWCTVREEDGRSEGGKKRGPPLNWVGR